MTQMPTNDPHLHHSSVHDYMPDDATFSERLKKRNQRGLVWQWFYYLSIFIAILTLIVLFSNVLNNVVGSIAVAYAVQPETVTPEGRPLAELDAQELANILRDTQGARLAVLVRDNLSQVPNEEYTASTLERVLPNAQYPEGFAETTINEIRALEPTQAAQVFADFLALNLSRGQLENMVLEQVIGEQVLGAWSLYDSLFNFEPTAEESARLEALNTELASLTEDQTALTTQVDDVTARLTELRNTENADLDQVTALSHELDMLTDNLANLTATINTSTLERDAIVNSNITTARDALYPDAELIRFYSWLNSKFLSTPMSSVPAQAGVRTALLGSLAMMIFVVVIALPISVGTAIYLEEYAKDNIFSKLPEYIRTHLAFLPKWLLTPLSMLFNLNAIIETNVRNLAGVPSIIYGMLGLAIFVRMFAPVTSGVAFGANVSVPSDQRIVSLIEPAIPVDLLLDEDSNYSGIADNDLLTSEQANDLIIAFRRLGTPSASNVGNIPLAQAQRELATVLEIPILATPQGDELNYSRLDAGFINFGEQPITEAQFTALASALQGITGFTINGRTILSAALTLSLLILPVIIINAQEALRAVPSTLREASYGLGATKWQTIWRTVLPAAVPGIMTGTILAVSRAVGETAPLIVVGASTFLLTDPTGPFSKFTVLPIQIYNWTSRPQGQFQFIAAAAIIVLLVMILSLNAIAIFLRNRYSIRY